MISFAVDAIAAFSARPLRVAFYVGVVTTLLTLCYLVLIMRRWTAGEAVEGWTSLMLVAVLFLGSVQLVTLEVVGEYIGRHLRPGPAAGRAIWRWRTARRTPHRRDLPPNDSTRTAAPRLICALQPEPAAGGRRAGGTGLPSLAEPDVQDRRPGGHRTPAKPSSTVAPAPRPGRDRPGGRRDAPAVPGSRRVSAAPRPARRPSSSRRNQSTIATNTGRPAACRPAPAARPRRRSMPTPPRYGGGRGRSAPAPGYCRSFRRTGEKRQQHQAVRRRGRDRAHQIPFQLRNDVQGVDAQGERRHGPGRSFPPGPPSDRRARPASGAAVPPSRRAIGRRAPRRSRLRPGRDDQAWTKSSNTMLNAACAEVLPLRR